MARRIVGQHQVEDRAPHGVEMEKCDLVHAAPGSTFVLVPNESTVPRTVTAKEEIRSARPMLVLDFALNHAANGIVTDAHAPDHVGICTDTTIVTDEDPRFERCLSFNGKSSKISIADIVCPTEFTIAVWLRKSPYLSFYYAAIVAFGGDVPFFGLKNSVPVLVNSLTCESPLDTSWNHLAAMQDAQGSRIYLNGQLIGSSPSRARTLGRGMVIGSNPARRNAWFEGKIASVTLFDEALTEDDLLQLILSTPIPILSPAPAPMPTPEPEPPPLIAVEVAIENVQIERADAHGDKLQHAPPLAVEVAIEMPNERMGSSKDCGEDAPEPSEFLGLTPAAWA